MWRYGVLESLFDNEKRFEELPNGLFLHSKHYTTILKNLLVKGELIKFEFSEVIDFIFNKENDFPVLPISLPHDFFWVEGSGFGALCNKCLVEDWNANVMDSGCTDWDITKHEWGSKAKYVLSMYLFDSHIELGYPICIGRNFVLIDGEGNVLPKMSPGIVTDLIEHFYLDRFYTLEDWKEYIYDVSEMFLLSLTFMSVKNVSVDSCEPSRSINKKFVKRNGIPLIKYHVLNVIKPGVAKASDGGDGERELPLHLCRGHFRTYREKPLFGKLFGTYFIPSHLRGNQKNGVVQKDYRIKYRRAS